MSEHEKKSHTCPVCSESVFRPASNVSGIGGLYYFIGECTKCNSPLQSCPECESWDIRRYGENICRYCKVKYSMPTIEEEQQILENGKPSFIQRYKIMANNYQGPNKYN